MDAPTTTPQTDPERAAAVSAAQDAAAVRRATLALNSMRDTLAEAVAESASRMKFLRESIIATRPKGLLTVDEMAEAIDKDRNYVDSVWSEFGQIPEGKQTRVTVDEPNPDSARYAYETLSDAANQQSRSVEVETAARRARDTLIAEVYQAKTLGPTAIAREVGVDRNHVLRIARKAGVKAVHRPNARNQYTR